MQQYNKEERSLPSLITELTQETSALVQKEVELAKAEISEKVSQVGSGLASLATGGAIAFAGFLVLLAALTIGVDELIRPWARSGIWAPLIVGAVVLIIGIVLLQRGRSNLDSDNLAPSRTAESLRRDRDMVKEQLK